MLATEQDMYQREQNPFSMEQLQRDLMIIEENLKHLVSEYEDYLCGAKSMEPKQRRVHTESLLMKWRGKPIGRTAYQFQVQRLAQKFDTFKSRWNQGLRAKNKGLGMSY